MAVAHDAATESSSWTTTPDPFLFAHTPVGTPRAAILYAFVPSATAVIDAMPSYGATAFSHVWSMGGSLDGEAGRVFCYFLDNVASGEQNVSIPHTAGAEVKIATVCTLTAAGPLYPVALVGSQAQGGAPTSTYTVNLGAGSTNQKYWGGFSGLGDVSGLTVTSGTTAVSSHDYGGNVVLVTREDTPSTNATMGATGVGDDSVNIAIAVSETEEPLVAVYRWVFTAGTTAHAITTPTVVADGDLLFFHAASSINGGTIAPSGGPALTRFDDDDNEGTMVSGLWYVDCDGTEDSQAIDFVTSTATNGTMVLHVIHVPAAFRDTAQVPEATVTGPTATGTPDPSPLTPSWGSAANLWLLSLVRDAADGISSLTADYAARFIYTTTTGAEMATSWRYNTATSEDPGASTVATTDEEFKAYVVAVKPVSAEPDVRVDQLFVKSGIW